MHDNCDTCKTDYDFTPANSTIYIFLDYPRANFVEAVCPNGHAERIFSTSTGIVRIATGGFPVVFSLQPPTDIRQAAESAWEANSAQPQAPPASHVETATYDLTPHLTTELERFTKAVSSMPDDLLYDSLITEQPSDLPTMWRGADTRPGDHDDTDA